jgi:hypothetical protein
MTRIDIPVRIQESVDRRTVFNSAVRQSRRHIGSFFMANTGAEK